MSNKTLAITDALYDYWLRYGVKESAVLQELRLETQKLPTAEMQIAPEQGQFMYFLTRLLGVKNVLEIGVYTGYSSLAVALALPTDGKLLACDQSKEWTDIAQLFWQKAGVADKIELRLAPALQTLDHLIQENARFDLIFIDADKISYDDYFNRSMQLLDINGVILLDNMFFGGEVANEENDLPATRAIRALNARLSQENNIDICLLPIGDGLTMVRKCR